MLGVLFSHPEFGDQLVFKGGTSLAKIHGVIQRFSEDIDLSVAPAFLQIDESAVDSAGSTTQCGKWMKMLEQSCAAMVGGRMLPELERVVAGVLGASPAGAWLSYALDEKSHSPLLLFDYPTLERDGFPYLRRTVKMEFGSLTDQRPVGRRAVRPWVAEVFPGMFEDWRCEVVALELERTFWEKATILHAEYHRQADQPMPDRYSRHYADMVALARHPLAARALELNELRQRVVDWKSRFFACRWARYELARPGTFRLAPPDQRMAELKTDYAKMRQMFIQEPLLLDELIQELKRLEATINSTKED